MTSRLTRGDFLAKGATVCLGLSAGGALVAGCARLRAVDVVAERPAGAPKSFLAKETDVNPAFYFVKGKVKGVLVRTDNGIVGYANKCTHKGGPTVWRGNALTCVWHGSTFDAATGKVVKGPAQQPLTPLKLEVRDGWVLLCDS